MFPYIAAGVLALALARPALANDIAGVRIGSTLSEASIAIKRANRAFSLRPLKYASGEVAGLTAVIGQGGHERKQGAADEFAVLQDHRGKVWFVGRYQRMVPGSRIGLDALLASLSKKFGEPALRTASGRNGASSRAWDTDRAGKRIDPSQTGSPCDAIGFERPFIEGVNIRAPVHFPGNCGRRIALSNLSVEDGLVNEFTLHVIDVAVASQSIRREEADRKAALERERQSGKQPQI